MRKKIIHNFLHGQLFFSYMIFDAVLFPFPFLSCFFSLCPYTKLLVGKLVFRPNEFCQPFHFRSLFLYGTVAVQSFRDINWPICMFQWASERKWHLQSFLFLGRERIIALHCFKAYQVSKAFHSFLGSRYASRDARLCHRRSLYWRYLSNLWSLYLDLTNSYWFSSSILVLVAWLLPEKIEQLLWYLEIPIKSVCSLQILHKRLSIIIDFVAF